MTYTWEFTAWITNPEREFYEIEHWFQMHLDINGPKGYWRLIEV